MAFTSLRSGKAGNLAGLAFKQQLEAVEQLEKELLPLFINEVVESVEYEQMPHENEAKALAHTIKMKDNAARTLHLMTAMARYSGVKRGTLPRDEGKLNPPTKEIDEAKAKVHDIRLRLKQS